jgi:hypothetical protein
VKNAPAVTARRATNQIVLVVEHQALVATVAATPAVIVLEVIVLAEQTVRVVTMRLIDHVVMAHRLIDRAAMVRLARLAHLETVPIPRGLHAMEIVHIRLGPHVTVILDRHGPAATAPTRLVLLATVMPVRVAMARTAHVSPAATANRAAGPPVAMVILQVGLRVPGETGPIRRAPRARDRVLIVHEVTVRIALVAIGLTVLAPIGHTAISRAVSGSPMGESVVRSARR